MAKVPYIDDLFLMGEAFGNRRYEKLHDEIINRKASMTEYVEWNGEVFGFLIHDNGVLVKLYDMPVKVVRFFFSCVDTLHEEKQQQIMEELFAKLETRLKSEKMYYQLRLPGHVVDAMKAFQKITDKGIFCGGTTYYSDEGVRTILPEVPEYLQIYFANKEELLANREEVLALARDSFREYQGQYHISGVTDMKAGDIYENWIQSELTEESEKKILLARKDNKIVGFCILHEEETGMDWELSAVSDKCRGYGIYKLMASELIRYANKRNKFFYSSTQLDNYISQRTWASLGMKPFYTIYNIHYDMR